MQPPDESLAHLTDALRDVVAWLDTSGVEAALIGGAAAALHGRPRFTRDLDFIALFSEDLYEAVLKAGRTFGFTPRLDDTLEFARRSRMLLVRHDASGIDVDIAIAVLPFEQEALERVTRKTIAGIRIPIVSAEDLIVMKIVAGRPHDFADIESLLDSCSTIDEEYARRWVREFADALEAPKLVADFERLLTQRQPTA